MTFYKIPAIAKMLGLRRDTVTGLIRRGELAGFDVGSGGRNQWRVSQQALDDFTQARAVKPPKVAPRRQRQAVVPVYFAGASGGRDGIPPLAACRSATAVHIGPAYRSRSYPTRR